MRTRPAGGGDRRRPRRRRAGHHRRLRLLAPRGPAHHARPERGQHGRLRVHGAGRPGQAHRRRELGAAAEPRGRAVLRQARSRGALLRQDRQHRRRRRGRRLSLGVPQQLPQPELVPVRGPAGELDQRPEPQLRPDLRPLLRALPQAGTGRPPSGSRNDVPVAPDNVGPKTMPELRATSPTARSATCPGGGKTFVGPVDDPFFVDLGSVFDGINIDKPGRPAIGLGNQGGGKDDVSRLQRRTRSCCRCPPPTSPATAAPSPARRPRNAVVGVWASTERKAIKVNQRGERRSSAGCRSAASATR